LQIAKKFSTCGILNVALTWHLPIKIVTTHIEIDTVIRGYHVHKQTSTATLGEVLSCRQETDNFHNCFAVVVMKGCDVVGHVPKEISSNYLKVAIQSHVTIFVTIFYTLDTEHESPQEVSGEVLNQFWFSYYSKRIIFAGVM